MGSEMCIRDRTFSSVLIAQKGTISGTITENGEPLIGASVFILGTSTGTATDFDGNYNLSIDPGTYTIEASYTGYSPSQQSIIVTAGGAVVADFSLAEGVLVDEIVVTGTRASNRTNTDAAVPIDVIDVEKLALAAPQSSINSLLHNTTPVSYTHLTLPTICSV